MEKEIRFNRRFMGLDFMFYLKLLLILYSMLAIAVIRGGWGKKAIFELILGIVSIGVFVLDWFLY